MGLKKIALIHDYQEYANEFEVGTVVSFLGRGQESAGRVTRVWPGIGVVDVQFPSGNFRIPVEDLQILTKNAWIDPPTSDDTTAGRSIVNPRGPSMVTEDGVTRRHSVDRLEDISSSWYSKYLSENKKIGI